MGKLAQKEYTSPDVGPQPARWVYYLLFPVFCMSLCAASYYLGFNRGRYHVEQDPFSTEISPELIQELERSMEPLTFYDSLKEDEAPAQPSDGAGVANAEPTSLGKPKKVAASEASKKAESSARTSKEAPGKAKRATQTKVLLQMGAFRDIGRAHELADGLKNKGYPAFTKSERGDAYVWYRVFVGPYPLKERAKEALKTLEKEGFQSGFLIQASGD